jgi:hypothetical protein
MHEAVNESKRRLRSAVILQSFDLVPTREGWGRFKAAAEANANTGESVGTDAARNSHSSCRVASCSGKRTTMKRTYAE